MIRLLIGLFVVMCAMGAQDIPMIALLGIAGVIIMFSGVLDICRKQEEYQ